VVDDPDIEPVVGVRAGVRVTHEELLAIQELDNALPEQGEVFLADRDIDVTPVHRVPRGLVEHGELVVR
jgi:hypothetical protein